MSVMETVGIADFKLTKPPKELATYALGSCVGICIYDANLKLAGLSHILLPDSQATHGIVDKMKYADTAIPELVRRMEIFGAKKFSLKAKIIGGAQMFASNNNVATMNIGERNILATREQLKKLRIPIVAEEVGGTHGRTIYFNPQDGSVRVKSVSKAEKII